jgi:hypothetical protein
MNKIIIVYFCTTHFITIYMYNEVSHITDKVLAFHLCAHKVTLDNICGTSGAAPPGGAGAVGRADLCCQGMMRFSATWEADCPGIPSPK